MNRLLLFTGVFYLFSSCSTWQENGKKDYLNIEFNGTVESRFLDPDSRMQPVIILNDKIKYRIANMPIFENIKIGDTIFKRSGSMRYYLIKNGDTIVFYQRSAGKEIVD
jgi:hypothetical protein